MRATGGFFIIRGFHHGQRCGLGPRRNSPGNDRGNQWAVGLAFTLVTMAAGRQNLDAQNRPTAQPLASRIHSEAWSIQGNLILETPSGESEQDIRRQWQSTMDAARRELRFLNLEGMPRDAALATPMQFVLLDTQLLNRGRDAAAFRQLNSQGGLFQLNFSANDGSLQLAAARAYLASWGVEQRGPAWLRDGLAAYAVAKAGKLRPLQFSDLPSATIGGGEWPELRGADPHAVNPAESFQRVLFLAEGHDALHAAAFAAAVRETLQQQPDPRRQRPLSGVAADDEAPVDQLLQQLQGSWKSWKADPTLGQVQAVAWRPDVEAADQRRLLVLLKGLSQTRVARHSGPQVVSLQSVENLSPLAAAEEWRRARAALLSGTGDWSTLDESGAPLLASDRERWASLLTAGGEVVGRRTAAGWTVELPLSDGRRLEARLTAARGGRRIAEFNVAPAPQTSRSR